MCSNSLDDAPEVFSHPNESVICHLYLFHCVLLCVGVCAQFLMFPCVPGAWMSPGLYCQSPKCFLSLSFLPIYSLLIHFSYISTFTSWLLILYYSVPSCLLLVFISHTFVCAFMLLHLCLSTCTHAPLHSHCTFLLLSDLQWELWVQKGREEEDFLFCNRNAGNHPVWVWKRSMFLEIPWSHGYMMPDKRWSVNSAIWLPDLPHIW